MLSFKKERKLLFGFETYDSIFDFLVVLLRASKHSCIQSIFHAYALASHKYLSIRGKLEDHGSGPEGRDDWY